MSSDPNDKPWLVMLYLAGDNSLSEEMVLALQTLQAEGAPKGDRIFAQFDPSGVGLVSQRYAFKTLARGSGSKEAFLESSRDPNFTALETNMGSPRTLIDFIQWARGEAKVGKGTHRQFLILSGHGSGTTEDFLMKDEASMDSLTIDELRDLLVEVKKQNHDINLDILGMDACYMAMGEIAYEIRQSVDIMIGPEGLEPCLRLALWSNPQDGKGRLLCSQAEAYAAGGTG